MKRTTLSMGVFLIVVLVIAAYLIGLHNGRTGEGLPIAQEALAAQTKSSASPIKALQDRDVYYPGTEDLAPDEMRVVALGTGMPSIRPKQAAACFLVELGNGDKFLFDIGQGSASRIAAMKIPMGWIYGELQDHRQAMAWNIQGIETAREANFSIPECECNGRLNLGDNLCALGQLDEAEKQFQKVEQVVRNPRPQDHYMLWRYSQHFFHSYGDLWLLRGDLNKAKAYADECLALAEQSNSQKNIVKGLRLRGQVLLAQGMLAEAGQELSSALKVALRVGNPTQLWKTSAVMGDLRQTQERPNDACRAYGDALAVIEKVAAGLTNKTLRDIFMGSHHVQEIRQKARRERMKT